MRLGMSEAEYVHCGNVILRPRRLTRSSIACQSPGVRTEPNPVMPLESLRTLLR